MHEVGIHPVDIEAKALADLRVRLRAAGVDVAPRERPPATPGVLLLCFDRDEDSAVRALEVLERDPLTRVVALGRREGASPPFGWRLRAAGAQEVLAWDAEATWQKLPARLARYAEVDALVQGVAEHGVIGTSHAWTAVLREIVEVAAFTSSSLVLLGESGTGKERLARLVHALDRRRSKGKLVTLDCTTLSAELSSSEFFGHERGAFTGAIATRDGAFAQANGGTLFLDEVGELPLALQAQLLRVVQEKTFKRVGGNDWFSADFRLICATNVDLRKEVDEKRFRLDFFHRIGSWLVQVPALRERADDIPVLAEHFMRRYLPATTALEADASVRDFLRRRRYPGNVRELEQVVRRLCGKHVGGLFTIGDLASMDVEHITMQANALSPEALSSDALPPDALPPDALPMPGCSLEEAAGRAALSGLGLKEIARLVREAAIRRALAASDDNVQAASRLLKVTDRALQLERAKREV
jgi:transcriptional regulator with GAF, ATPase, and Fis domain